MEKNNTEKNSINKISSFYELMLKENLEELEIKNSNFYLKLKRYSPKKPVEKFLEYKLLTEKQIQKIEEKGIKIKSPLNGVFYRAPSPTSKPYVKEGDIVERGVTLCIIEAMKIMNEIKAEFKCEILKILVENGKSVNADQDIFLVRKIE